jgi:hypothetical protein
VGVLLGDFLGLEYRTRVGAAGQVRITLGAQSLDVVDQFFACAADAWLSGATLPKLPLPAWDVADELPETVLLERSVPVLYGLRDEEDSWLTPTQTGFRLGVDLFGAAFFLLSRYEEAVVPDRDNHDRFPSHASVATRAGFLHRPLVNEYLEILWSLIRRIWPGTPPRPHRTFRVLPSHDVDSPFLHAYVSPLRAARRLLGDLAVRRLSPASAWSRIAAWHRVRAGRLEQDPYNTFDLIMDQSEQLGAGSAFYFICGHSGGRIDGNYAIGHPLIRRLLNRIADRGHEIGVHPSYNTYLSASLLRREVDELRRICEQEQIPQPILGGRQHFLRWRTPDTFRSWEQADLSYDSTLSFADRPGFRCGTCYEYQAFDVVRQVPLALRERPLVLMECSLIDDRYMALGTGEAAMNEIDHLKAACRLFSGDFTVLWHNNRLVDADEQSLYGIALAS